MSKSAPLPPVSVPEIPVPELPVPTVRELRFLWPIVGLVVLGTAVVVVWAVVQMTSIVAPERVFVDHDSGISLQFRQLEAERARGIESAHDATLSSLLRERNRDLAASHDAGIATLLKLQAAREAAIASAYDAGIAAQVAAEDRTQASRRVAVATAYDSGIASMLRSQAGSIEVLGSTCSATPPNAGGWEVRYHRAGC